MKKLFLLSILPLLTLGCVTTSPPPANELPSVEKSARPDSSKLLYSVYLVGDAGGATLNPLEPSLDLLRKKLNRAGSNSAVVFLGDNVYPDGLPDKNEPLRKLAEDRIQAQLKTLENFSGNVIFVAGNHDWDSGGPQGLSALKRQEQYIESRLDRGDTFLPDAGTAGPAVLNTGKPGTFNLSIIALDTHWWLHPHQKLSDGSNAGIFDQLREAITDSTADQVLVVGHHPLYSKGPHGGNFPLKTHLLPPVGGSFYVLYRNIWGTPQDISSKKYRSLKSELTTIFADRDPLIYASGHDHSLQYLRFNDERDNQHYIISGSASRTSYAKTQIPPQFALQTRGFSVLYYYEESIWVEFWDETGRRLFESRIDDN